MKTFVFNHQSDLSISEVSVKILLENFFIISSLISDEVHVHFVTEKKITELHALYFSDPTVTDTISFPFDPPIDRNQKVDAKEYLVLGEVFVCPKTAMNYVKNNKMENVYKEVSLYLIHGLLHLLGYDDQTDQERSVMREKEMFFLNELMKNNALLTQ